MKRESRRPGEGDGSGSRQSESIKSNAGAQSPDTVDVFCAGEREEVRALRRLIHKINASAARRAARASCDEAREVFWWTAILAGTWTFRPASEESLRMAVEAFRHMGRAASLFEQLETPDEGPEAA